jgi:ADP-ribose pyrophosphatase YjhB (NUDIX family)
MAKHSSSISSAATLVLTFLSTSKAAFTLPISSRGLLKANQYCINNRSISTTTSSHNNNIHFSINNNRNINNGNSDNNRRFSRKFSRKSTNIKSSMTKDTEIGTEVVDNDVLILPYEDGTHGSAKIIIQESDEFSDLDKKQFKDRLEATIEACRQLKKSAFWITVPMSHASLIESMVGIPGLEFHHATGMNANLCLWLKDDVENKIPEYATHQVGVGAMVVNSKDEILCVREIRNNYRPWKIPGGLAELGEQLDEAAIREVKEETGIDCQFKSVLSFRHTHGMQFGRSDFYFVCRLEPVETKDEISGEMTIPEPVAQEGEIAAAAWVSLPEYRAMVNAGDNPHPMMQKILALYDEKNDIQRSVVTSIVPGRKPSPIYHAPPRGD